MNVPRTRRSRFSGEPVSPKTAEVAVHRPVLLHESVQSLHITHDDVVLDATLGGAGHAQEIVHHLDLHGTLIGFDLDADAIARAKVALADATCKVELIQANFRSLKKELEARGISRITKALFDLGWSSYQLDSGRGFSLKTDEPLVMTYAKEGGAVTARIVVNDWSEETLADIIYGFGEERYSRRIAKAIVDERVRRPIETASELAEIIYRAVPAGYRHGKIHPATRTFQALRIAVNDELGALTQGLRAAYEMLEEHGLIAVITFHSIEDRAVKQLFAELERQGKGKRVTKKPMVPGEQELSENRRARSAKLRVFEKDSTYDKKNIKNKQIQTLDISGKI
jgi:16S rRNA (cytosine1402-N4)-methyltransferase